MQELRLLGVHTDGEHLLLAAANGNRFRLPITGELRSALRRVPSSVGQNTTAPTITPREIQAHVRAGYTAEHIADAFEVPIEHVERYEGPVLAERAYMCELAAKQHVRTLDGERHTLGEIVAERLELRDAAPEREWDSWRNEDGSWTVQLAFIAGGRERTAQWEFRPSRAHVEARNDESRWFMHDTDSPAADDASVGEAFGVQGATIAPHDTPAVAAPEPSFNSTEELLEHLQSQRGVRHSSAGHTTSSEPGLAGDLPPAAHDSSHTPASPEVGTARENAADERSSSSAEPTVQALNIDVTGHDSSEPAKTSSKSRRPKVPSWDEIMFGSRRD